MTGPARRCAAAAVAIATAFAVAPASAAALNANDVRIGSSPAFVRVVVDFSGGIVQLNEVMVLDTTPADGRARVELRRDGVTATPVVRSGQGVTAELIQRTDAIEVRLTSDPRTFKYIRTTALTAPQRLVIDLYRSRLPATGGNIRTGPSSCLRLTSVARDGRRFRVRGVERNLFEGSFVIRIRDAAGRVVGRRVMTARGAWSALVPYPILPPQAGTVEAVASSAKDGSLACIVQQRVMLRR